MTTNVNATQIDFHDDIELKILFWTLIIAIISLIVTSIFNYIDRHQGIKLNSINLLKDNLEKPFTTYLVTRFCEIITSCTFYYLVPDAQKKNPQVSFDSFALIEMQNTVSNFLGEVAFLNYASPRKFSHIRSDGESLNTYIEKYMLPYALFEKGTLSNNDPKKQLAKKKAEKIHKRFIRKVKKFYKCTFKIYRYGL